MIKKVDVTIVCKAVKENIFDGFDDEKIIKILDESAEKVNNECCKVSIQPNLRWQKLKEWVKENKYLQPIIRIDVVKFDALLDKMQELEGEDE